VTTPEIIIRITVKIELIWIPRTPSRMSFEEFGKFINVGFPITELTNRIPQIVSMIL